MRATACGQPLAGEVAAAAQQHVADGFDAVKLRIAKEPTAEAEARRVQAVARPSGRA